jgi:non-heme chloroperoxidase
VSKAVFIASITPYLLKTQDNPEGVDGSTFEGIRQAIIADRPAFLTSFFSNFYNTDVLKGKRISDEVVRYSWNVGVGASPRGTLDCVTAWLTDFRKDLAHIDVPTLVIHGDNDRILPVSSTANRMSGAVKGARVVVIKGGPHGLIWTHADEVNKDLVAFLS